MSQLQLNTKLQSGKYVIKKVLGQGGFGITYLAEQTMLGKQFAIKEFFIRDLCTRLNNSTVTATAQSDMVKRYHKKFIKEAQIIARFEHPGIVHVNDIFEENGTAYYVMNYVEGENLDEIIKREGALTEERALGYITKVADALDYIHRHNVNHLDIKPANIMIRKADNEPILIDFGVSKQYDEHKDQTTTTPPGVSNGYSPLEQYRPGGVSTFSPQADIYALGATLFKLLTGKTPPNASDMLIEGLPRNNVFSPNLREVIERAMQPRYVDRPKTVKEWLGMFISQNTENVVPEDNDDNTIMQGIIEKEEKKLNSKENIIIRKIIDNMVFVEGGTFIMGATIEQGNEAISDENPAHQVTLSSFRIGRFEVTEKEWNAVMGSNSSDFNGAMQPIENVNWEECKEFIQKLNAMTGMQFRFPTEAEWEFAARGGKKSRGYKYAGGNDINPVAWYCMNSYSNGNTSVDLGPHPVGQKFPNELGLYDMSGNVYEWCEDKYASYSSSPQKDPRGASYGSNHVLRGGCWFLGAKYCRVSYRSYRSPERSYKGCGLRLAL